MIRPEAKRAFADNLRNEVQRHISQSGEIVAVDQLLRLACAYGTALTTTPGAFDKYLRLVVNLHDLQKRGIDHKGKWLPTTDGYIYTATSGLSGRFERTLPQGVRKSDVLKDLKLKPSASGRERLSAILEVLSTGPRPPALEDQLDAAETFASNALEASAPHWHEGFWRHWASETVARVTEAARQAATTDDAVLSVYGEQFHDLTARYDEAHADAVVAGSGSVLLWLYGAVRGTQPASDDATMTLMAGLQPTIAPRDAVERAIRHVVALDPLRLEGGARKALELADEAVDAALEAAPDPLDFYPRLREALPLSWAAQELTRGYVRSQPTTSRSSEEMARLANVAEERRVRIQHSLERWPLDFHYKIADEERKTLRALGAAGERRRTLRLATDLIEQHYFYPRSMRPLLLESLDAT